MYGQSELFTIIRQLEFSILRLTQRLDELRNAIQYVVMGSLPGNLISPTTLYDILKNVLFHLPENYEQQQRTERGIQCLPSPDKRVR
jgi:hypothetical protein